MCLALSRRRSEAGWEGRERERGNSTEEKAKLFAESRMKRGAVEEVPESVREPLREGDRVEW